MTARNIAGIAKLWGHMPNAPALRREVSEMSDLQRGSPDDQFINVNDWDELRHWSRVLQVTPEVLRAAVGLVGTSAVKARAHLELRSRGHHDRFRKNSG